MQLPNKMEVGDRSFFGVGSGRYGTMLLTNLLNSEKDTLCLHEGKVRNVEESGEQILEYLTLQNRMVYHDPSKAFEVLGKTRNNISDILRSKDLDRIGDIAYFYAPFVHAIPEKFPNSKLIVVVRDGIEFVRSAITNEIPDPTPVGWLDRKPINKLEKFISLGRLKHHSTNPIYNEWDSLSEISKNAWLWSETNKIIFQGIKSWTPDHVLVVRFEELSANTFETYLIIRKFLGYENLISKETTNILSSRINARAQKKLPEWNEWSDTNKEDFVNFAGDMMHQLGYKF